MNQFREYLNKITEERQQRDSIIQKIELLERQKVVLLFELDTYTKRVNEEVVDVNYLETLTLSSIVNSILQNKLETLEREKEHLYTDQFKVVKINDEILRINNELGLLQSALEAYKSVDDKYRRLTEEMTQFMLNKESSKAIKLDQLFKQRGEYERERIYLHESLNEGEDMLKRLDETKKYLLKAKKLDLYTETDVGLMTNVKIYHYLDEAQEMLHQIQWGLRKYYNALTSLGWHEEAELQGFMSASDYWIDGIFSDNDLKTAVNKLIDNMNEMMVDILKINQQLRKGIENSKAKKAATDMTIESFFEELTEEI